MIRRTARTGTRSLRKAMRGRFTPRIEGLESRALLAGDVDPSLVIINELHVQPDVKTEQVEFIELYNRGSQEISLEGWHLRDAVDYQFPAGTSLAPGAILVVAMEPGEYQTKYGKTALGPWTGQLANEGETVELWANNGQLADRVQYQLGFPWPTFGDIPGPSIQLINPGHDNDLGGNWRSALPTPGAANSVLVENGAPQMRQVNHSPEQPKANEVVTVSARITDPEGVASVTLEYQLVEPGDYIRQKDPRYATDWGKLTMQDNGQAGDAAALDGVYTVQMPAELQTHRRLVRYRITAVDAQGASRTAPYEDDPQPNFAYFVYNGVPDWTGAAQPGTTNPVTFDSSVLNSIPVYHLITRKVDHQDAQFIPSSTRSSGYTGSDYLWEGTLVYEGRVYDHIQYRARGGVWRYAMGKNMWKFDFERGHSFQAREDYGSPYKTSWDKLNFSSVIQQGDYLHRGEQGLFESVGFRLFNLAGSDGPKTNYVHFRIVENTQEQGATQYDSDFQGLYLAVEQVGGRFLDEHDLPDGNLYKIEGNAPESVSNQGPYQVSDKSDVRSFLSNFVGAKRPTADWWRDNLGLQKYYGYQAISEAIHHYDTAFGKNFFYYNNPETNRWEIISWDLDLTWADNMYGSPAHEFNVKVAKNPTFNSYTNQANISLNNRLNHDYQNRVREIRDLLYNPEQTGMLIDEQAGFIYQPDKVSFVDADRAQWDYNPILAKASKYTDSNKNGVRYRYYNIASTKNFSGMIKLMKDYVVKRGAFMDRTLLTNEANIPKTPSITHDGDASFPVNGLTFKTSAFESPIGAQFSGMKWRIAEVTDPNAPGFNPYDTETPRSYEIDAAWESDVLTQFKETMTIPAEGLKPGKTYRVRVRMRDNDNHWSHWSAPVQFVAGAATANQMLANLRISEINYNPHAPTPAEIAAGHTDKDDFEFLELTNIGSEPLSLAGASLDMVATPTGEQGVSFAFSLGAIQQLGPGQRLVVVNNLAAFQARYGNSQPVAGQWTGGLGNGGEQLTLSAFGSLVQQFNYSDLWYPTTDGQGATLETANVRDPNLDAWARSTGWQPSKQLGGSPGTDGSTALAGDANRDGVFNSADLILAFQGGKYEDGIPGNATWAEGDWNGDGDFTTADLVRAFQTGAYSTAAQPAAAPAPRAVDSVAAQGLFDDHWLAGLESDQLEPRKKSPSLDDGGIAS